MIIKLGAYMAEIIDFTFFAKFGIVLFTHYSQYHNKYNNKYKAPLNQKPYIHLKYNDLKLVK